jgi:Flp pilus assembly protein TadG
MIKTVFVFLKNRVIRSAPRTRRDRSQCGQSAVEIALLLPLLLLILFGIILAGFIFYAHIQVSNAVREGARAGSIYRLTQFETGWTLDQTVRKAIYNPDTGQSALGFLSPTSPSFDASSDVTVTLVDGNPSDSCPLDTSNPCPGDKLTVRVVYRYTMPVMAVALPMFPQPLVMQSNVMMEIQ